MKRTETLLKEIFNAELELCNHAPEKIVLTIEKLEKQGYRKSVLLDVLYTGARDDLIEFDKEGNPIDRYEQIEKEE